MVQERQILIGIVAADTLRALGLATILEADATLEVVVSDLETAVADERLAVLLMDDRFEGEDVIATVARLGTERPDLKVIVLGEAPDFHFIQAAIAAGARGYLLETTNEADIRMAIAVVLEGSVWAPQTVLTRLIESGDVVNGGTGSAGSVSLFRFLTARERQVLELLIDGRSNREIGSALGIDEVTVKAHLGRMLRKTRSKNRVELTLRALEERAQPARQAAGGAKFEA